MPPIVNPKIKHTQFCVFDDVLYSIGFFVGADTAAIVKHRKCVFYHEDDDSDIACEAAIFVMALKPSLGRSQLFHYHRNKTIVLSYCLIQISVCLSLVDLQPPCQGRQVDRGLLVTTTATRLCDGEKQKARNDSQATATMAVTRREDDSCCNDRDR